MTGLRISNKSRFTRSAAGNVVNLLFLFLVAAAMALPMVYTVSSAFKPSDELFLFPPRLFVSNPTIINFTSLGSVMRDSWVPVSRYLVNSIFITVVGVIGQVVCASMAAYVLSRDSFPGQKLLNSIVVLSLMFSATVTAVPTYVVMVLLGLVNTHFAVILPAFCSSLGLFLMKQFMDQMVPMALLEAARIDGAGEFRIYFSIVMPICRPAWLTLIIFSFQSLWSNSGGIFIFDEQLKTLPYALNSLMGSTVIIARAGVSAAVSLLMVLPPLLTFILTQSNVLETMSTSGMKE